MNNNQLEIIASAYLPSWCVDLIQKHHIHVISPSLCQVNHLTQASLFIIENFFTPILFPQSSPSPFTLQIYNRKSSGGEGERERQRKKNTIPSVRRCYSIQCIHKSHHTYRHMHLFTHIFFLHFTQSTIFITVEIY